MTQQINVNCLRPITNSCPSTLTLRHSEAVKIYKPEAFYRQNFAYFRPTLSIIVILVPCRSKRFLSSIFNMVHICLLSPDLDPDRNPDLTYTF